MNDTICAVSTSQGYGAIAIIRVSGPDTLDIVSKIFKGKDLKRVGTHTINYGHIVENNEEVDEVLVSVMLAPKTYTKEDIIEINTHGGPACISKVLELLLNNGCRLAEPGEFTKRAFLNGRINLLEAEAVMDKINAKTEIQNKLANNMISGKVSDLINDLRDKMIELISNINVNIDYPEYDDVQIISHDILKPNVLSIKDQIEHLLKESESGKIIKNGIKVSIVGKPNVGKSSLLNALLEEEKAIVTDIAGTTRDIVEGSINLHGIILDFIDTAGIRNTSDVIEAIGVKKSREFISQADLVILVINNNEEIDSETLELIDEIKTKNYIVVINKMDLDTKLDLDKLTVNKDRLVNMSIKKNIGLDKLKDKIFEIFNISNIEQQDPTYLCNARSINILKTCLNRINDILKSIEEDLPIDMLEIDLKNIWEMLGTINGTTYEDELLDEMFSRFCLGK